MRMTALGEDLIKIMLQVKGRGVLKPEWENLTDEEMIRKWNKTIEERFGKKKIHYSGNK